MKAKNLKIPQKIKGAVSTEAIAECGFEKGVHHEQREEREGRKGPRSVD
jgi:hypothetical protein